MGLVIFNMSKKKTFILSLVVMFLWGSLYPMVKLGFTACEIITVADVLTFAGLRFAVCGAVICVFSLLKNKKSFIPVKFSLLSVIAMGLFAVILHYGLLYLGLQYTDSSKTAILKQIGTLFYICFSALFFKDDRLSVKKVVGVILGLVGVVAINFTGDGFSSFKLGDLFIIIASFCIVFSNVIGKHVFNKVEPVVATGCSQFFGGVILLVVGFIMGGSVNIGFNSSLLVLIYILIASVISYCIWYYIVKESHLSNLFIIKFAEPLFSCLFGWILLKENIWEVRYLVAFLLISIGIFIANYKFKKIRENKKQ